MSIREIDIEAAIDVFEKAGVDHGAAAAVAYHIGQAMRNHRALVRLRTVMARHLQAEGTGFVVTDDGVVFNSDGSVAHDYVSSFTPDAFEDALSMAFVPSPVLRGNARFTISRPDDGCPFTGEVPDESVVGVCAHALNATLGTAVTTHINAAVVTLRPILRAAGGNGDASADGFFVGYLRGIAETGRQMRRLRGRMPGQNGRQFLLYSDAGVTDKHGHRLVVASIIVMAAAMGYLN